MKRHLNLMSDRARVRTTVHTRIRQWSLVFVSVVILLVPLLIVTWWPVAHIDQEVASLEAQYRPTRQLKETTLAFKEQIHQIHAKEHTSLALAEIDTPVVTLLGVVGKIVAESDEQIVLDQLDFSQDTALKQADVADTKPLIQLQGIAVDKTALDQLTDSLQKTFPFGKITLVSSDPERLNQQIIHRFRIQCSL